MSEAVEKRRCPEMLTIRETAERAGLSYGIVRRWCLKGMIPIVKSGNKTYVNYDRFVDFLGGNGEMKDED